MKSAAIHFLKLVLVCVNERPDGEVCCAARGSADIHKKIKELVKAADPTIRVSKTGCLGNCTSGTTVVIMPDNVWLGDVQEKDVPELVKMICAKI
jgi:(2Fe-2S) ferredoxin